MRSGLVLTDSQMKAVMTDRICNRIRVVLGDDAGTVLIPISVSCDASTAVQWKVKVKTGDSSEGAAAGVPATVQWSCDGSTWLTLMTGHIDSNGAVRSQGYVFDDTLTFTIVDMTSLKGTKRKPASTAYAGYYICNPSNTGRSLVHILGGMMGVTAYDVGDLSAYTKDIVELGSDTVWQELQALAECYDADLAFTSDGKLYFHSPLEAGWTGKSADWTLVATRAQEGKIDRSSGVIGSIQRNAPSITCNRAKSTYSTYERGDAGSVIYRDTTNWNESTKTCHITVPGKTRYPESGYLSLKYKDPDSGEEYPYAIDVQTPKIGGRGSAIYAVGGKLQLVSFDGSTADTQKISGESQIVLYNSSSDTCTIESLEIRGTPYRKTAESTVEEADATITDEVDYVETEVDGKYAAGQAQLSAVLSRLVARGKTIHRTVSLETSFLPQVQVGEVMRLVTDDDDDIWEVTGYKHTMKGAQMSTLRTSLELLEVTDYTPASAPKTVVRHPQASRQTTAQTQIEYAAWPDPDLPPVPDGTYVIDGVVTAVSDSTLTQESSDSYWSNGGTPATQAGDFVWMRTRTGGGTWVYQMVTPRRVISSITYTYAVTATQDMPDDATSTTIPAMSEDDKYLWRKQVITYNDGTSDSSISLAAVYGDRGKTGEKGDPGATGATGWSQATLQLFKRSATAPSAYDGEALTYTFSTATLAGNHGSWSVTIPGGSNPLYVIYAPAFGQGETDVVEVSDWTVPAILSENGTRGENGDTVATVMLYQRSASTPAKPTGVVTYNFLSGQVSNTGSWSNSVPASDGNPLWVITAVASVTGSSNVHEDTIQPTEWSTPSIMAKDGEQGKQGIPGEQGPQGEKGDTGATGNGISKIEDKYLATATDSTPTAGWADWNTTDKAVESKPYLWNWTRVTYTNGTVHDTKTLIATWVKGADGTDGASFVAIEEQYCRTTTATAPTTGWASTITNVDKDHRYLWNRSRTVTKNSAGSTVYGGWSTAYIIAVFGEQGIQGETGPQGEKGDTGLTGATGNGIKSVTVSYGVSASPSTQPTSWQNTVPAVSEGQYLWTRTITDYTDDSVADTVTYTYAKQGKTGGTGATGATGNGIASVAYYYASTTTQTAPAESTVTSSAIPTLSNTNKYLWQKEIITFTNGVKKTSVVLIGVYGDPGTPGSAGKGIASITEYYLASASSTAPGASDSGWSTTAQTPTEAKPYLWNKTVVAYTTGSPTTTIAMIGQSIKGNTGAPGGTGATGTSVTGIIEEYALSTSNTSVTGSWGTAVPTLTETNRYLWNRSKTQFSNGTTSGYTTPVVIGVYGNKGNTGASGTSVTVSSIQYQAGTSATTAPTGTWSSNPVSVAQGQFLWTKTTFSDGKVAYGIARQGSDGKAGASGRGISSIAYRYATTTTQSQPAASAVTSPTIPAMSKSNKYLWRKTVITYTDSTQDTSVELIAVYGDTGDSASIKDFDVDISPKTITVGPRWYTRSAQTIVARCTLIHVSASAVTITWSTSSTQAIKSESTDKLTCTFTIPAHVAADPFTISCTVTGVGLTKTFYVDVKAEPGDANVPVYLGTNWDTTNAYTPDNDPIWSGDYYLDTSTNTPMIASVSGSGTITYSAMQTGNPNTALIMGTVLSDILAQGSGVQSTCVAVNAYFGAIAAKTGFIESLRSQVIQSANYSEDSSGNPVTGYKLDGPNNVIKAASMKAVGGMYRGISIEDGSMEITDGDTSIFKTVSGDNENVVSISANGLLKYYNINSYLDTSNVAENTENSTNCMFKGKTYQRYCRSTKTHNVQLLNYTNPYSPQGQNVYGQNIPIPDITYTVTIDNHCDSVSIICEQFYAYKRLKSDGSYEQTIRIVKELKCRIGNTVTVLKSSGDIYGDNTFSRTLTDVPAGAVITCTYSSQYYKYVVAGSDNQKYALEMPQDTFIVTGMAVHEEGYLYLLNFDYSVGAKIPLGKWYLATENQLVIGSHSSSATHTLCKDFLELLELYRSASVDAKYNSYYNDGTVSLTGLKTVLISSIDFTVTTTEGNYGYNANEYIKGVPQLEYHPVYELKGITALNLNASTGISQIGTDTKPFANTWTKNINNVPVSDSDNQVLNAGESIVGAINQINRDLAKKAGFTFKHQIIRKWTGGTGGSEVTYDCIANDYLPNDTSRQYVVIGEMSGYDKNGHRANIQSDIMRTATGIHSNSSSGDYPNPNGCYSQSGNDSHRQFGITFIMPVDRYIYYTSWTTYLMITLFGYFVF